MPEQYTTEVPADRLNLGDDLGSARGPIVTKDVKTKYVYITAELDGSDAKPQRLNRDEMILVTRERPTAEENALAQRKFATRQAESGEQQATLEYEAARERMAKILEDGKMASHWEIGNLLAAQATYAIWEDVRRTHEAVSHRLAFEGRQVTDRKLDGTETVITEFTRWDAVEHQAEELRKRLLDHGIRLTSRSTSVLSNVCEDYETEAKLRFVERAKHYGL